MQFLIKNIIGIIAILILCTACDKQRIEKYHTKIEGTWQFEKVTKNTTWGNNSNFHSRLWEAYQITFDPDGKASLFNTKTKEKHTGNYLIAKSNLAIDEDYPFYLDIEIYKNNQVETYVWYFRSVNKHKLKILTYIDKDTYYYRLNKLN